MYSESRQNSLALQIGTLKPDRPAVDRHRKGDERSRKRISLVVEEQRPLVLPGTTIAGHCVLPAVPAKALRTSKGSAAGILAAFCRPETQQPWTALLGSELAVQLGIR